MSKPAFRVTLDGEEKTDIWGPMLESLSITDEAGTKSDTCEVAFDGVDHENNYVELPISAPPIGGKIEVWLGYEPQPVFMGSYIVDSWSKSTPPKRLTVSGAAANLTGDWKGQKLRSFHQMTVEQIIKKIAADHGATASVDPRVGSIMIEHIDQTSESDLHFGTRLAKRTGAVFKVANGQAIFALKGSAFKPDGKGKARVVITPDMCSSCSVNASERGGYGSASAHYMDHVTGKRKTAIAGTPAGKARHRDKKLYGSKVEAETAAKANLGDLTRGKRSGTAELVGTPYFFAECVVELSGFDPDMDGEYLAKSVTHKFDSSGYTTSVSFETQGEGD